MKLLFLDIETAPCVATVWGLRDQNIAINQMLKPGYTLCWAAQWKGDRTMHYASILNGRKTMVRAIHKLLMKADAVCHYNGESFDIPMLNSEFMLAGLPPPTPSKQVDLYRAVRRRFRLPSYKLEFVAKHLGIGCKVQHKGHELWLECMAKKKESFAVMERYNKQDVKLLEGVYDRILPWIDRHPNRSVMADTFCCPRCESKDYQQRGVTSMIAGIYRRYSCKACGHWFRINIREPSQKTKALSVA